MTKNILSPAWRGQRATPIDPATIRFTAAPGPVYADCCGCIFIDQSGKVCRAAQALSGMDCDAPMHDGHSLIFVLDKTDVRQMILPIEQQSEAAPAATGIASITNN